MKEKWRDVKDYDGLYQVSNLGRVRSLNRIIDISESKLRGEKLKRKGVLLKPNKTSQGYYCVKLCKVVNGKSYQKNCRIHRLVATAFIVNSKNKKQVNHTDGNKGNNKVTNLEWCTPSENVLHSIRVLGNNTHENHGKNILSKKQVDEIRKLIQEKSTFEISKQLDIPYYLIKNIKRNTAWFTYDVTNIPDKNNLKARKLSPNDVRSIRDWCLLRGIDGITTKNIANAYQITPRTVCQIHDRSVWNKV